MSAPSKDAPRRPGSRSTTSPTGPTPRSPDSATSPGRAVTTTTSRPTTTTGSGPCWPAANDDSSHPTRPARTHRTRPPAARNRIGPPAVRLGPTGRGTEPDQRRPDGPGPNAARHHTEPGRPLRHRLTENRDPRAPAPRHAPGGVERSVAAGVAPATAGAAVVRVLGGHAAAALRALGEHGVPGGLADRGLA